ncbi:hypothetical protein WBK31_34585 [Nonomuraea sp. N2-4H]|uniref:hypothetical protein n=1 Tax=Nonomuraea sp. N2-4H TaxID=3128898 RepID=UPI0032554709
MVRKLGGGGMGEVYLGRSPGGRDVALKVVRPELADDPDFRRRPRSRRHLVHAHLHRPRHRRVHVPRTGDGSARGAGR